MPGNISTTLLLIDTPGDTTPPTGAFAAVTSPRNTHAGSVDVTFSESVTGVDIADFTLTRDGANVALAGGMLTDPERITLLTLSTVTTTDGAYVLTLTAAGSGIIDIAFNALLTDATRSWTKETVVPTGAPMAVTTPRNTSPGTVNLTFSESVTGVDIAEFLADVTVATCR